MWALALDLLVVLVVLFCWYKGYRDGLLKTAIYLGGYVFSYFMAMMVGDFFGRKISALFREKIYDSALLEIQQSAADSVSEVLGNVFGSFPKILSNFTGLASLSQDTQSHLEQSFAKGSHQLAEAVTDNMVMPAVMNISQVIFFIISFMVMMFVVKRVARLTRGIHYIPIVGGLNRLGGGLLGLMKGALFGLMIAYLLALSLPFFREGANTLGQTVIIQRVVTEIF